MKILILVIAVATTMCDAEYSCPQFWNLFNGNCYRYYGDRITWSAAEARCKDHFTTNGMGHLASVLNLEENRFIYELFKSSVDIGNIPDWEYDPVARYPVYGIWIGLHQDEADGPWVNSDGKDQGTFERWVGSEPNNNYYGGSQVEDCVHIWRTSDASDTIQRWNDMYCNEVMSFVCKMPANGESCNDNQN